MKKIHVAVGMHEDSHQIIRFADGLAQKEGAELTFFHVSPEPVLAAAVVGGVPAPNPQDVDFTNVREKFADYIAKHSVKSTHFIEHEIGVPQHVIAQHLEKTHPDLLIMGAHDHSLAERLFLGSTANYVLHHTKVPVYLHRPNSLGLENYILAPVDIQSVHPEVIRAADHWAQLYGAQIVFLYVDSHLPYYQSWAPEIYSEIYSQVRQESTAIPSQMAEKLEKIIEDQRIGSRYSTEVVKGTPGPTIVEYQKLKKCKWVFLASHSYRNVERFLLGSVTDFLVNHGSSSFYIHK